MKVPMDKEDSVNSSIMKPLYCFLSVPNFLLCVDHVKKFYIIYKKDFPKVKKGEKFIGGVTYKQKK